MKILSSLPSELAKISDLVTRDVRSEFEVHQETAFPLLQFASPLRTEPPVGNSLITQSCMTDTYLSVVNAGAQTVNLGRLAKGIWDITATLHYSANYRTFATNGFNLLLIDLVTSLSHVIMAVSPATTSNLFTVKVRITLDRDDLVVQTSLGGNTAGQDHFASAVLYLAKLF